MVYELFASEGSFWAALLQFFSTGVGGDYLGYFLTLIIGTAIYKFVNPKTAIAFVFTIIPILAGIGLVPEWLVVLDIMIVGLISAKYIYERFSSG